MNKTPDEINMNAENAFLLREAARAHSDGYSDHLAHGGKGDPAEECWIEALFAGADALDLIQQLETANAELLTTVKQLEAKCHQLERERDAAVKCIGRLMVILKTYPYAATNGCAYQAYCEIQKYVENMRGVKEE